MTTVAERFQALVDRNREHHLWRGAVDRNGVPQFRVNGRLTTARRVAWELHHGPLPDGTRVRGCADEPRCVRADHLSLQPRQPSSPRTRRRRGDGSMREMRRGVWQLTITTNTGHRTYRTVRGDSDDATRQLSRLAVDLGYPPATVDALVTAHHGYLASHGYSPSTIRRYAQLWNTWLAPTLGVLEPREVHQRGVEATLAAMACSRQSERSIHQAAVVLNTAYAWACEHGLAERNPVVGCELPNGDTLTGSRRRH